MQYWSLLGLGVEGGHWSWPLKVVVENQWLPTREKEEKIKFLEKCASVNSEQC